jgi:hypothetical protein
MVRHAKAACDSRAANRYCLSAMAYSSPLSFGRTRKQDLLLLCARIGYTPPA